VSLGEALADDLRGSFMVTLLLPTGLVSDSPVLDRVLWVDTASGWYAMRPGSDRDGDPLLDVVPVEPGDIGPDLAPLVAAAALALGGTE
jgi:hypothetical protein